MTLLICEDRARITSLGRTCCLRPGFYKLINKYSRDSVKLPEFSYPFRSKAVLKIDVGTGLKYTRALCLLDVVKKGMLQGGDSQASQPHSGILKNECL